MRIKRRSSNVKFRAGSTKNRKKFLPVDSHFVKTDGRGLGPWSHLILLPDPYAGLNLKLFPTIMFIPMPSHSGTCPALPITWSRTVELRHLVLESDTPGICESNDLGQVIWHFWVSGKLLNYSVSGNNSY